MSEKTYQNITLALLVAGTAASLWFVFAKRGGRAGAPIVRLKQRPRDADLGGPSPRKYFGFSGESSAQGAGAAASPPPSIRMPGSRKLQTGGTLWHGFNRHTRPTDSPGQNGSRFRPFVGTSIRSQ